jgi:hypothetical protein
VKTEQRQHYQKVLLIHTFFIFHTYWVLVSRCWNTGSLEASLTLIYTGVAGCPNLPEELKRSQLKPLRRGGDKSVSAEAFHLECSRVCICICI